MLIIFLYILSSSDTDLKQTQVEKTIDQKNGIRRMKNHFFRRGGGGAFLLFVFNIKYIYIRQLSTL